MLNFIDLKHFVKEHFFLVEIVIPFRHTRGTGMVLSVGQGDVGQLGLGPDVLEKSRPALVDQVKDVIDVVAGGMHTVCLTSKGKFEFLFL